MNIIVREYLPEDVPGMIAAWNRVVEEGVAFPQTEGLTPDSGAEFFAEQTACGAAIDDDSGAVAGMYILHPNNVGRCGHICNASYAVAADCRGRGIGELLVRDCIERAAENGFRVLQFNAVVSTNTAARRLYEKLGFVQLGTIPGGFLMKDGHYEDICPYYRTLSALSGSKE